MTDIQNISRQLMKPAKELASWNFPLSQILEEYFKLLPEPSNIRYGEAALVIQNSVNAYVRKVEDLYDETKCFIKKMLINLKENRILHNKSDLIQTYKSAEISFGLFELNNFEIDTGCINLKNDKSKVLKFLHRCFPKLENANTTLHKKVFDRKSKIIGKKYDFRCNQQITRNGILMEELTPNDFKIMEDNYKTSKPILSISNNHLLQYVKLNQTENNCDDNLISDVTENDISSDDKHSWLKFSCHSDNKSMYNQDQSQFNLSDSYICNESILATNHDKILACKQGRKAHITDMQTKGSIEMNRKRKTNDLFDNSSKNDTLRRSKRLKQEKELFSMNTISTLKAVPFINGVPEKNKKCRKKFSYHKISAKNITITSKKLHNVNNNKEHIIKYGNVDNLFDKLSNFKQKVDSNFLLKSVDTKDHSVSSSQSYNQPLFKECFAVSYKPTSTLKVGLVNIDSNKIKFDNTEAPRLPSVCTNSALSQNITGPKSITYENDFFSLHKKENEKNENTVKVLHNYKDFIKYKIAKIYEELDIQTDDDKKVAEWHQQIKPRLQEAELKSPFNIHEYEFRIMQRMSNKNRKILFDELIKEEPPCEIARYFSAALQLASTCNVDIHTSEDQNKSFELILLE